MQLPGGRKGSALVEAALLVPLVISCIGLLISISVQNYISVSSQSAADLALRRESGIRSETILPEPGGETARNQRIRMLQESIQWNTGKSIYPILRVKAEDPSIDETLYFYDEAEYIRLADLL